MFDFTDRAFDAYIAPAKPYARYWRLAVGILISVALFVVVQIGAFLAIKFIWGDVTLLITVQMMQNPTTPIALIGLLLSIPLMLVGVLVAVKWIHKRRLLTLFGDGPLMLNFAKTVLFVGVLFGATTIFRLYSGEGTPNMSLAQWLPWALLFLPVLLLQVGTEEIIFRGYLMQQFAAFSKNPIAWMIVPSVMFGSLHFQPTKFGMEAAVIVVVLTSLFGMVAADLTRRTGNLGAAIGLHFVNNLIAIGILPLGGTMTGISLYVSKIHVDDKTVLTEMMRGSLIWAIGSVVVYFSVMLWLGRRAKRAQPYPV